MKERMQKTLSQVNGVKNYAAIVRIMSYTDIGRHINKLINVS